MLHHRIPNPIWGLANVDAALVLRYVGHGVHTPFNKLVSAIQEAILLTPAYLKYGWIDLWNIICNNFDSAYQHCSIFAKTYYFWKFLCLSFCQNSSENIAAICWEVKVFRLFIETFYWEKKPILIKHSKSYIGGFA